ncbi:hypothetical protein CF319_g8925, partial [Tilletia indica]
MPDKIRPSSSYTHARTNGRTHNLRSGIKILKPQFSGHLHKLAAAHLSLLIPSLCFRRKQIHSMKEYFAATCETSRC